ncbi:MAG: LPS export ABC transporter periplasmic protein LptC [Candidatus Hydrogenedentota bacterium]
MNTKPGQIILSSLFFIFIGYIIYWAFYSKIEEPKIFNKAIEKNVKNLITGGKYIRASEGKIHWEITADETQEKGSGEINLKRVYLKFYDIEADTPIIVNALEAIYSPNNKIIKLKDNVVIKYGDLLILTDELNYEEENGFLFSKSNVEIRANESVIYARGLKAYTREKKLKLFNVKGNLRPEDIEGLNNL